MAWRSVECSSKPFAAKVFPNISAQTTIRCIGFINGRRTSTSSTLRKSRRFHTRPGPIHLSSDSLELLLWKTKLPFCVVRRYVVLMQETPSVRNNWATEQHITWLISPRQSNRSIPSFQGSSICSIAIQLRRNRDLASIAALLDGRSATLSGRGVVANGSPKIGLDVRYLCALKIGKDRSHKALQH